jgi:hypothetical protein
LNAIKSLTRQSRVRRTPAEWQDIIHRYEKSSQTQEVFCADHALALSTFSRWRSRLAGSFDVTDNRAEFVELSSATDPRSAPQASWDVELQLGAGIILRLRHQC